MIAFVIFWWIVVFVMFRGECSQYSNDRVRDTQTLCLWSFDELSRSWYSEDSVRDNFMITIAFVIFWWIIEFVIFRGQSSSYSYDRVRDIQKTVCVKFWWIVDDLADRVRDLFMIEFVVLGSQRSWYFVDTLSVWCWDDGGRCIQMMAWVMFLGYRLWYSDDCVHDILMNHWVL